MATGSSRRAGDPETGGVDGRRAGASSVVRAIVLVAGASVFAYLFGVVVHEIGHYLASSIVGVPDERIVLHPFDLSYNAYGSGADQVALQRLALQNGAGPVLNVFLGVTVSLSMWRRRSATWLPLLIWGPVALVQESVGMIIGLVDYPDVRSDWVVVMEAWVSPVVIAILSVVLLIVGSAWMLLQLPLMGIRGTDGFWRKVAIFLAGIPLLLLGAVVYLAVFGSSAPAPPGMVQQNRNIALGASIVLVAVLAALHGPFFARLDRISHTETAVVEWRTTVPAVVLGAAVFAFMLAFFN